MKKKKNIKSSQRLSIWKSKRGGIPAINELVLTFLNTTPRPILLLIFLLLITTIASFIVPAVLNLFGYECVQVGDEIKLFQVPMDRLAEKSLSDVKQGTRAFFGFEDYRLPDDPFPKGDKRFLRVPPECFVEADISGVTEIGYSSACVDCNKSGLFRYWGSICTSDGYYDPDFVTSYWIGTANFCYVCAPPNPYYYNHTYCFSEDECFFRILPEYEDDIDDIIDSDWQTNYYYNTIISLGGVERQQDSSEIVNVQCQDVNKPQLYFFTIEVFNRTMWTYLFLAGALISLAYMYYGVVL
jgi:hypothetical protein